MPACGRQAAEEGLEEGLGQRCKYFLAPAVLCVSNATASTWAGLKWAGGEAPFADFLIGLGQKFLGVEASRSTESVPQVSFRDMAAVFFTPATPAGNS